MFFSFVFVFKNKRKKRLIILSAQGTWERADGMHFT